MPPYQRRFVLVREESALRETEYSNTPQMAIFKFSHKEIHTSGTGISVNYSKASFIAAILMIYPPLLSSRCHRSLHVRVCFRLSNIFMSSFHGLRRRGFSQTNDLGIICVSCMKSSDALRVTRCWSRKPTPS